MLKLINFDYSEYNHVTAWMVKMLSMKEVRDAHAGFYKVLKRVNPEARL